jgi:Right handed beta helix region
MLRPVYTDAASSPHPGTASLVFLVKNERTPQFALLNFAAPICLALVCAAVTSAHADIIAVTNTNDSGPGSLRQALTDAHDADTIVFAVTGTIELTSGGLLIAKNITISGPGSNQLSIDGNQALFVFGIFPGKTATISGLTMRNAEAGAGVWNEQGTLTVSDCAVTSNSYQGLYNDEGTLNVNNCVVSGNSGAGLSTYHGVTNVSNCVVSENSSGGLVSDGPHGGPSPPKGPVGSAGSMTIADSIISDNLGPGVSNVAGFLTVLDSTLSGNSAAQAMNGAGIMSGPLFKTPADATIINTTISGNSAPDFGGGIAGGYWRVTIVNSTISENTAGNSGGGISGTFLSIMNSTISGNSAGSGGGIYHLLFNLHISNTILNAGASGENIFNKGGTITSHGYNISSDDGGGYLNGPGDQIKTDPLLGPLQDNGGPTLTHALLPGSPAIDAGDPNFTPPPFYDQRGCPFLRVFNGRADVGSFEAQPPRRPCSAPRPRPTPAPRP